MKKWINLFQMKLKSVFSKRDSGFTLAEIMVTAGIVSVLAVAIMRMNSMAQKTSRSAAENLEAAQVANQIQRILSDGPSCELSFKGLIPTAGGTNITKLKRMFYRQATNTWGSEDAIGAGSTCQPNTIKPVGTSQCTSGTGAGKVGIYKMSLRKAAGAGGDTTGILEVKFLKGKAIGQNWDTMTAAAQAAFLKTIENASGYGAAIMVKEIPLNYVLDGTGKITDCYTATENLQKTVCENLGPDYTYDSTNTIPCRRTIAPTRQSCHNVILTAVGTVNYATIAVGNTGMNQCAANEIVGGIQVDTATTPNESAIIEGSLIRFPKIQITIQCCQYK